VNATIEREWRELSPLLDDLFEVPEAERASWLARHVPDASLRVRLEQLLRDAHAPGLLDRPGSDYGALLLERSPLPELIDRANPYRVLELIGEGGMASVYRAECGEGEAARAVAIKVMRVGMLDPFERERFSRERRILARLEHPHIARLLDGGLTAEGVPWIALEYVPGEPITRFCDEHFCDIDARLRLFLQVCEAVQFAHQALVVHRDLKPNNILVRQDGTPKLLDFGIAKLIDDSGGEEDATRTEYRRLTPGYAAPEQFAHGPVTTATDVYALGVLLHELLTGTRPQFRVDGTARPPSATFAENDATRRAAPRAATPRALRNRLAGDLDCIVSHALRSDPARRYSAVSMLREDVARHLDGAPIRARPDAWSYRAGKFLKRHALSLGMAASVLGLLLGAAIFSLDQANVARQALARADQEAKDAAAENDFLISTFASANPFNTQGAPQSAHDVLLSAASRVDEEFADSPRVRAKLHDAIGELFFSFKQISRARREYAAALEADRAFLAPHSAELLEAEITVQIQRLFQGQIDEALPELERIEREARAPGVAYLHAHYRARENIALAMSQRGDYAAATALSESLLEESDRLAAQGMRTYAKYNLSNDYLAQERLDLATRAIDEMSRNDIVGGNVSPGALFHVREQAELLLELGRVAQAHELLARLRPQARKTPELQAWFYAEDLAHEAEALRELGDTEHAHATYRLAFETFARAGEAFPPVLVDGEYGDALTSIAGGDSAKAVERLRTTVAMYAALGTPAHPMALASRAALAAIDLEHDDPAARAELESIASTQRARVDRDLPYTLLALAQQAQRTREMSRADALLDETLDVLRRQGRPWHPYAYRAYLMRASAAQSRGDAGATRTSQLHALAAALTDFGEQHPRVRTLLAALGKDAHAQDAALRAARALVPQPPAESLYRRALATLAVVEHSPDGSM